MSDRLAIRRFMTPSPFTIGSEQTIARASELMRKHAVRHLPVLHGGELVGVLTERDVAFAAAVRGLDPERVTVGDAMMPEAYTVHPDAAIGPVVQHMADRRYGCVVVMDGAQVIGILTAIDAMRILARLIERAPEAAQLLH